MRIWAGRFTIDAIMKGIDEKWIARDLIVWHDGTAGLHRRAIRGGSIGHRNTLSSAAGKVQSFSDPKLE